jgi:hypothetical protein
VSSSTFWLGVETASQLVGAAVAAKQEKHKIEPSVIANMHFIVFSLYLRRPNKLQRGILSNNFSQVLHIRKGAFFLRSAESLFGHSLVDPSAQKFHLLLWPGSIARHRSVI